jgi:cadmium resistance protein CadD (predicted permease)
MLAGVPADLAVALTAFVGTNVDNALVTTAMVATAPPERATRIAVGQLVGFTILVAVAAGTAVALFEFSTRIIGLLGLVPLAIGLRGLVGLRHAQGRSDPAKRAVGSGVIAAVLISIASGGDNLAVYIPLFRVAGTASIVSIAAVFAAGELLLSLFVLVAGRHPQARELVRRIGVVATPILYCAIGVLVLVQAGTFSL